MSAEVQAFLEGLSVWTVIAWVAGVLALGALGGKVYKVFKALTDFLDDVKGEPARAGVPERPGIMARLESIETRQEAQGKTLEVVRHELFPNSGKSLRDQTNRIEEKVDRDDARIIALGGQVSGVEETVTTLTGRVDTHIEQSEAILEKLTKEQP